MPAKPAKRGLYADFVTAFPYARTPAENLMQPDIVLVQAPGWGVNTPPLATAMLAAQARRHGYKVLPLDLNLEFYAARRPEFAQCWDMEQSLWFWNTRDSVQAVLDAHADKVDAFVELVCASGTAVVGFTVYSSSSLVTLELAHRLKAQRPELVIVLGGPHVSRDIAGRALVLDPAVDAVAQGEGEATLIDILERVTAGRSLHDCPGLLLRVDGQVVDTGDREPIRSLDELPPPDFSDVTFQAYRTPTRLPLMGSRGCPNRCIYCNERQYWGAFRFRSAESLVAEIRSQIQRYPFLDFVEFQDSLVNGKISQLDRLADLLIASGLNIHWAGQAVVRKEMTLDLMVKLKQSGCVCLAYGLETPSSGLMRFIGKLLSKGADIDAIAEAHGRSGLGAVYNVMFGLPGETEADSFAVLEFLRRNRRYGLVVNPSPSFCGFSPGTPGFDEPDRFGIDVSKGGLYWESKDGTNTYLTRLKRFEDFCRLVAELGIETTYPASRLLDRDRALGRYYEVCGAPEKARLYYESWLDEHPEDRDIRAAVARLSAALGDACMRPVVYPLPQSTDHNWCNGVATEWATAFFVADAANSARDMKVGRVVVFADGSERSIVDTRAQDGNLIVFLEGEPLDGNRIGYPATVSVIEGQPAEAAQ